MLALVAPAAAGAACAPKPLDQLAREAPVVVTAKAQPGPVARNGLGLISPATFKVVAYDQGSGPQEIKVRTALTEDVAGNLTALSDGVNPIAGQTWRLWGTLGADGVLQTTVCGGSTLAAVSRTPSLVAGRRSTTLRPASIAGVPHAGTTPTLVAPRGGKVVLRLPATEANGPVSQAAARAIVAVRLIRGAATTSVASRWSAGDAVLSTKLSVPATGTSTVVVITRGASYAAKLRAG